MTKTIRTRPWRLREDSIPVAQRMADVQHISTSDLVHQALLEYFENHRAEFAAALAETQRAFQSGDLEALTHVLHESAENRRSEFAAHLED